MCIITLESTKRLRPSPIGKAIQNETLKTCTDLILEAQGVGVETFKALNDLTEQHDEVVIDPRHSLGEVEVTQMLYKLMECADGGSTDGCQLPQQVVL